MGGDTSLFVGAKGSGKSTITLVLGKAGATVFSEDHVMLRHAGDRFLVSGCDGKMHLTERSERHFFDRPLDGRMVESAGVAKKQIDMSTIFDCRPYLETEVRNLFFPRVGERFEIRTLAKEEAAARLLEPVLERHRFVDDAEQAAFLDLFARLVESCDTWEVDLSRDLRRARSAGRSSWRRPRVRRCRSRDVSTAVDVAERAQALLVLALALRLGRRAPRHPVRRGPTG